MKQITILVAGHSDGITSVTEALAQKKINILSIAGEHYGEQTVVNVSVDDEMGALEVLQLNPLWQIVREDALLLRIEDEVGSLAKIARHCANAGITLRSLRFVERHNGYALVAISTDAPDRAREILQDILAE